jgi:hypothetical protein
LVYLEREKCLVVFRCNPSVEHCKNAFMSGFALIMHKATPVRVQQISQWLVSIT